MLKTKYVLKQNTSCSQKVWELNGNSAQRPWFTAYRLPPDRIHTHHHCHRLHIHHHHPLRQSRHRNEHPHLNHRRRHPRKHTVLLLFGRAVEGVDVTRSNAVYLCTIICGLNESFGLLMDTSDRSIIPDTSWCMKYCPRYLFPLYRSAGK